MKHRTPDDERRGVCTFCEIVAGLMPCDRVAEDATTVAFMDIDPGADGHVLVIPKRHSVDLLSVSPEDLTATTLAAQRIARAACAQLGAQGVNLLNCSGSVGGQTVFHFHLHVIPRYSDTSRDRMELPLEPGVPSDAVARERYARLLAAGV